MARGKRGKSVEQGTARRFLVTLKRFASSLVLVHSLAQALPWLLALALSAGSGSYGVVEGHGVLVALSVGVGFGSASILLIAFANWYLIKRREGWKQKAEEEEEKKKLVEEELGAQRLAGQETDRMGLALKLIHDLNVNQLVVPDPAFRDVATGSWLTGRFLPAMLRISPSTGLALLQWTRVEGNDGEYTLNYDADVPEVVRSVLPKVSGREFTRCIAVLQLKHHQSALLTEDPSGQRVEWLIAFPERDFDVAADAVFSTGARIISDAWRSLPPTQIPSPS
jgi:hypothetical protein